MDELKGDFLMKAPALKERKNELEWCEEMSIHSERFGKNFLKSFMI